MKNVKKVFSLLLVLVLILVSQFNLLFIPKANATNNETRIFDFLKKEMGLNTAAACGVLANIEKESSFRNDVIEYGYTWESGGGYGICQWTNSPRTSSTGRRTNLVNWCNNNGYNYKSLEGQLYYLKHELNSSYYYNLVTKRLLAVGNNAQGAYDAAYYWCYYFEVPAGYNTGVSVTRGNYARDKYWPKYGGTESCNCSTSYAGTYTTKDVNSKLIIRSGHGTSYSQVGNIPANATFSVSKANGSWAHVTYNGVSGYVSCTYVQRKESHTEDTRYPTPFECYTKNGRLTEIYASVGASSTTGGWIDSDDICTVNKIYTNGWCEVVYPLDGGGIRTVYTPASNFIDTLHTPKKLVANNYATAYARSDMSTAWGRIYENDDCISTASTGNYYQVICEWMNDQGYRLVWVEKALFEHTCSYGSWSNYDSSYHSRSCDCGNVEKASHTWNSDTVIREATCAFTGIVEYKCTTCSATKSDIIPATNNHKWDSGTILVEPLCNSKGSIVYTCEQCSDKKTEEIDALGHLFGEKITEAGPPYNVYQICSRCNCKGYTGETNPPKYLAGDINGDGDINNKDLTRLLKYISGEEVEVVEAVLDVNGDNTVNSKDLTRLMKYLSGENVSLYSN